MNTAPSAPDHSLKLVFQTMPQTVNIGPDGLLPLGWTLAMLDRAGAVLPRGHFGLPVQLVHMASIRVHARPQLGDLVTFRARLLDTSRHTAQVEVQAATAPLGHGAYEKVLHAILDYEPHPTNALPGPDTRTRGVKQTSERTG